MSRQPQRTNVGAATTDRRLVRLAGIRGAWGGLLLIAPNQVIKSVPGANQTRVAEVVARILGGRHSLQAAGALAGSQLARRTWWVDAMHSATMAALALWSPAAGRLAGADALIAASFRCRDAQGYTHRRRLGMRTLVILNTHGRRLVASDTVSGARSA